MESPLVSIIIPVYNVSQYLRQCLDSVINQTYRNLEIILVDDGSTDDSGKICDEYTEKDNRILVIHKDNGGLSDARNVGIDQSKGIYISFVDSDDYIHNNQIEILVNIAIDKNVSLVICGNQKFVDDNKKNKAIIKDISFQENCVQKYSSQEAILFMLYGKMLPMYAWGKLYDAKLFQNLRFPKGKLFEDVPTTWNVMKLVDDIVYIDSPLYFYRQRKGSIVNKHYSHKKMDQVYMAKDIMEEVANDSKLYRAAVSKYYFSLADIYAQVDHNSKADKDFLEQELKKYGEIVRSDGNNKLSLRLLSFLGNVNVMFVRLVGKIYKYYKKCRVY